MATDLLTISHNVVGSTNVGALPLLSKIGKIGSPGEREERLVELTRRFTDMMEGKGVTWGKMATEEESSRFRSLNGKKNLGWEGEGEFRSDTLTDIHSGLKVLATGIQIVSTILTILGAEDTDRNDDFEGAVGTAMDIGATVLKVGFTKAMGALASTDGSSSIQNKVGIAAPIGQQPTLTPEELLHQQKVEAYVSKLTPEQVKLQQSMVQEHVAQQALEQGLNSAQTALLLAQTLQHNGLPQVASSPIETTLANGASSLLSAGSVGANTVLSSLSSLIGNNNNNNNNVNKVGLPSPTEDDTWVPGLPRPGTLEHTVTLAIFKAQQSLKKIMGEGDPITAVLNQISGGVDSQQPAIDEKLGVAADAIVIDAEENSSEGNEGGILATVAALPQSVSSAAVNLLKFVSSPPTAATATATGETQTTPGVTYSEVTTGIDPTYAALGLLTTGALGSVLYSYAAQDADFASSATSLAQGAVAALERNDIVNVATNALDGAVGSALNSASSAIEKIGGGEALAKITKAMPDWIKDKPDWLENGSYDYFDTGPNVQMFRDPANHAIANPLYDYGLDYGLYDYSLDQPGPTLPLGPYLVSPSPTYQTEFETGAGFAVSSGGAEGDFGGGGFFGDYFEGPLNDFQGSPEDSRQEEVAKGRGPSEQDQDFLEDSDRGEVGTGGGSVEDQMTIKSTAPPIFPHAIPEDVQFFEPSMETPAPSVPYVSYQADHNPWLFLQSGESTDHLYRSFS